MAPLQIFRWLLNEANHRLFIGCREPAKLAVLNTNSGDTVTTLDISGDADDVFYDAKRSRIYAIWGAGYAEIIVQADADHSKRIPKVPTASGARAGLFVAGRDDLFIAVSHRGAQAAEIRQYQVR